MQKVILADASGNNVGLELHNEKDHGEHYHLLTMAPGEAHGLFKAVSGTTAATTIVTSPDLGGLIAVTDILMSAEKKNTGTITLQMTDGSNTIIIFSAILTDNSIAMAVPLKGLWRGWKDARLEVVTAQDFSYTVSCGYIKERGGLAFAEWDSKR